VFSRVDGPVSDPVEVVVNMQLMHHAHSATVASRGRQSQSVSPAHTSSAARSANLTRAGVPGGGRFMRSLRVRWSSPTRGPGGSWCQRRMSRRVGMMWRCWRRPEVSLTASASSAADITQWNS
jgi:hypothetical protein